MVNKENIDKLIDVIKREPTRFAMDSWQKKTTCGTAHCLGGWAWELSGARSQNGGRDMLYGDKDAMGEWLGLASNDTNRLFFMDCSGSAHEDFDDRVPIGDRAKIAIDVLEGLKATGEVDWHNAIVNHGYGHILDQDDSDYCCDCD